MGELRAIGGFSFGSCYHSLQFRGFRSTGGKSP
jgi:hypothetical protein